MADLGIILLVICAIFPFALAFMMRTPARMPLEEPLYRLTDGSITVFPQCLHCGWRGEIDVTDFVRAAAAMKESTIMRSPPCGACGQRFEINLTTLSQKLRTGTLT